MTRATGRYVAEICVELGDKELVHAGLLLWHDTDHFLRLEVWRLSEKRVAILLGLEQSGGSGLVGRGHLDDGPVWLRLEREATAVRGLCSVDGKRWLAAGSVPFDSHETEQVGLAAHCARADAQVWFRDFRLWRAAAP
jgi:regulation of enolase protein 1 (concanavalin A-like superfamily)